MENWSSKEHRASRRRTSGEQNSKLASSRLEVQDAAGEGAGGVARRGSSSVIPPSPIADNYSSNSPTPSPSDRRILVGSRALYTADSALINKRDAASNSTPSAPLATSSRSIASKVAATSLSPSPSPSALALSLARSAPTASRVRSDSFPSPFRSNSGVQTEHADKIDSLPSAIFEPTIVEQGAAPAFLPTKRSIRYPTGTTELSASPNSMSRFLMGGPRSASGSSILSGSIHGKRYSIDQTNSASIIIKASATTSTAVATELGVNSSSRSHKMDGKLVHDQESWPTADQLKARDDESKLLASATMIGRKSRGWPSTLSSTPDRSSSSPLEAFNRRITPNSISVSPASAAASDILKKLNPAASVVKK